jgi:hypothetical protein
MLSLALYVVFSLILGMLLQSTLRFRAQDAEERPAKGSGHWTDHADRWHQQQSREDLSGEKMKASGFILIWMMFGPVTYSEVWWYGIAFGLVGGGALAYAIYTFRR